MVNIDLQFLLLHGGMLRRRIWRKPAEPRLIDVCMQLQCRTQSILDCNQESAFVSQYICTEFCRGCPAARNTMRPLCAAFHEIAFVSDVVQIIVAAAAILYI
jgi:hypothetical protein